MFTLSPAAQPGHGRSAAAGKWGCDAPVSSPVPALRPRPDQAHLARNTLRRLGQVHRGGCVASQLPTAVMPLTLGCDRRPGQLSASEIIRAQVLITRRAVARKPLRALAIKDRAPHPELDQQGATTNNGALNSSNSRLINTSAYAELVLKAKRLGFDPSKRQQHLEPTTGRDRCS